MTFLSAQVKMIKKMKMTKMLLINFKRKRNGEKKEMISMTSLDLTLHETRTDLAAVEALLIPKKEKEEMMMLRKILKTSMTEIMLDREEGTEIGKMTVNKVPKTIKGISATIMAIISKEIEKTGEIVIEEIALAKIDLSDQELFFLHSPNRCILEKILNISKNANSTNKACTTPTMITVKSISTIRSRISTKITETIPGLLKNTIHKKCTSKNSISKS